MEKENSRQPRAIILPGDVLGDTKGMNAGNNTYVCNGKICSAVLGIKNMNHDAVSVIPIKGKYMPSTGDTVIGYIDDIGSSNWMVDINSPYPAPLHVNEVPWKVEFGDTSKYLKIGDTVVLKVLSVDESRKIQVTMKDAGLRKIEGGRLVVVQPNKISRIVGKSGSMIQILKNMSDCRVLVGNNGRIWIDGDDENMDVVVEAIKIIEAETARGSLTDRIRAFMAERLPEISSEES